MSGTADRAAAEPTIVRRRGPDREENEVETAYEDETSRIRFVRGTSDVVVIAFTGVGLALGSVQQDEFGKSVGGMRQSHSVLYVTDKKRSWYNLTFDILLEQITGLLADPDLADKSVVTLGNSMGAFGAVLFAGYLPRCARVIAFCPQYSVSPAIVPFERRWREHTQHIEDFRIPHALQKVRDGIAYHLFFGRDESPDLQHAALFHENGGERLNIYMLENCTHDAAQSLKQRGLLTPVLGAIIEDAGGLPGEVLERRLPRA